MRPVSYHELDRHAMPLCFAKTRKLGEVCRGGGGEILEDGEELGLPVGEGII